MTYTHSILSTESLILAALLAGIVTTAVFTYKIKNNIRRFFKISLLACTVEALYALSLTAGCFIAAVVENYQGGCKLASLFYKIHAGAMALAVVLWVLVTVDQFKVTSKLLLKEIEALPETAQTIIARERISGIFFSSTIQCAIGAVLCTLLYLIGLLNLIEIVREYFRACFAFSTVLLATGLLTRLLYDSDIIVEVMYSIEEANANPIRSETLPEGNGSE